MRAVLLIVCLSAVTNLIGGCICEAPEPPSLPITRSWASGVYVPNHAGVETLRVRLDSVWTRSFYYPDGTVAVDSGKWLLHNVSFGHYQIWLYSFFIRNPDWAKHEHLAENKRRYDGTPTEPLNYARLIDHSFSQMRIWMYRSLEPDEADLGWYDKVGDLQESP
jgi:hypothetical protein